MNQIKHREVIRDDYGSKHYEIIREDGTMFVYDYGSGRSLEGEEAVIKAFRLDPRVRREIGLSK